MSVFKPPCWLFGEKDRPLNRHKRSLVSLFSCFDGLVKTLIFLFSVIPAKAGIQYLRAVANYLGSGLRRSDDFLTLSVFCFTLFVFAVFVFRFNRLRHHQRMGSE
jgi:hypothetical protein